jgi:hypothetical protein
MRPVTLLDAGDSVWLIEKTRHWSDWKVAQYTLCIIDNDVVAVEAGVLMWVEATEVFTDANSAYQELAHLLKLEQLKIAEKTVEIQEKIYQTA